MPSVSKEVFTHRPYFWMQAMSRVGSGGDDGGGGGGACNWMIDLSIG